MRLTSIISNKSTFPVGTLKLTPVLLFLGEHAAAIGNAEVKLNDLVKRTSGVAYGGMAYVRRRT